MRLPRFRDEDAPPRWRALAPGKVNLSLLLGGTRADGRHELVTVFESISLADELELTVLESGPDEVVCPGIEGLNLASTALERLRAAGWEGPPVRVAITKWIPVAGGMAGGSADAAATLRLASAVHPVEPAVLAEVAAGLGSDVPGQLVPGVSLGTGAGEIIAPAEPLAPHRFVIVPLSAELSTPAVFAEADRLGLGRSAEALEDGRRRLTEILAPGGGRLTPEWLVNDLEPASRALCRGVGPALEAARGTGADAAMVCGSGPTLAVLFWGEGAADRAADAESALAGRYPEAYRAEPVQAAFGAPQRL